MAQVLPAERDLRRVIGDGDAVPDGEVEGLTDHDLVELYRSLVLLRTYDERSVVYHRQGRIGTYAIYWNHEAIQAGSAYALSDEDWIFPSYRESAIGLLRGMPASTVLSWWRGHPAGWWNPADYNVASICVPIGRMSPTPPARLGKKLRGENACAIAYFGDGATSEGSFHEGVNLAAVTGAPLVLICNNNQWAISTPPRRRRAPRPRRQGRRLRDPGRPRRRARCPRRLRGDARSRRAGAGGRGPTFIEAVHYRAAPHATADDPACRPRARRGGTRPRVCRPLRGLPAPRRDPHRRDGRLDQERGRRGDARRGSPPPRRSRRPIRRCCSSTRSSTRRRRSSATCADCEGSLGRALAELTVLEAINDCFHVELERDADVMVMGEDVGRAGGVFRRLSGCATASGPIGASTRRSPRPGSWAAPWGCAWPGSARLRDAVRRFLVPLSRPADHAMSAGTAGGAAGSSASRSRYGCRTAGSARPSSTTTRPRRTTSHTPGEGRDPRDARRRRGPPRGGDPDPDPVVVLEPKLHYRTLRGEDAGGRPRRAAREGAARA